MASANTFESESNDTRATADATTLGVAIVGQLSSTSDIDYYAVKVDAAGALSLKFDRPSAQDGYFSIKLEDANGATLAGFTDSADPQTFTVGVGAAGTYYARITSTFSSSFYNGQYSLTPSYLAASANTFESESNDTRATADATTLGVAIVGQLSSTSDIDYYTFSAASAGVVALSLKTPTNSLYSYFKITIYDVTGLQISTSQTGVDASWNVNILTAGKYYVAIADGIYHNSGQYSLTVAVLAGTVVTSQNQTLNSGATIKASSLIASVSDPANNVITSYSFWDEGAGGGYLSLNGAKQASASWVTVAASDISKLVYIGGSVAGVENIDIAVYNGIAWSSYAVAAITTKATLLPALLVQSQSVNSGDAILASSLITSYSDPNQLQITSFRFWDEGTAGGYLTLNGVKQASSTWVTVTAADLSKVSYIGGATSSSEYIDIEVYNGHDWSDYRSAAVTTKEVLPAVLTVQNQIVDINASVKISSLISTVRDPNNYAVTSYRFWDEGSIGGYLSLNGVKQASATWVVVDSASLSSLIYVGGAVAGQESIDVEAWNGHIWSTYISALIITKANQYVNPPVIITNNQSVNINSSIQASLLIDSVIDSGGYQITSYQFRDNGIGGGYFIFNNNKQDSGKWIAVSTSQLNKLLYVGGVAAGTETVDVAAYDDHAWSTYKTATLTTTVVEYSGPVVVAQNQTVNANSAIQAITLITSITEPNNFTIVAYGFWDEGVGGGYLALEGVKQLSGKWIVVSATDLRLLSYIGGSSAGVEKIDIVASNGQVWSSYAGADVTTAMVSLPEITTVNRTVFVDGHIAVQSLIGTINDPANLPILSYAFRDEGNSGGYLSLDGVPQTSGSWIVVAADNISILSYFAGTQTSVENIGIKAQDANGWSNYSVATVLTQGVVVENSVVAKLSDATIKSDVTVAMVDNSISYSEMLKILSDVMLAGVTASEFSDLKTLYSCFNKVGGATVDAYVFDISNKVINGDPANQYWTGGALTKVVLGNLAAGSSQSQMDELIKKWFLGEDLPSPIFDAGTVVGYVKFTGQLYGSGGDPLVSDINQGYLGDCYLLASLAEVANCEPNVIKSMITDNGNGTYGVRFYIQGKAVYVTVNSFLPVDSNGVLLGNRSANLWSSLIEKAYVQLNEEPGYLNQTVGNIYKNIDGGLADPITEITGRSVTTYNSVSYSSANWLALKSTIVTAIKTGLEVDFGDLSSSTHVTYFGGKVSFHGGHMFAGIGYDDATGSFIIRNPWGIMAGQNWNTEFEATMADLYSEHGVLFVANGSLGAMAFSTSLAATDNIPPVVTSFSPLTSAINVAADTNLVAVFSEDIQRGVGLILLKTAAGVVVASYDAATSSNLTVTGSTLTINPTADLAFGTAYSVEFAAGSIKDLAGNDYAGTTSYNFTAAAVGNSAPTGNVTINGVATQGQTLTATNSLADADGLGAITYQWKADDADIGSAASSTLVLGEPQVGKVITVVGRYTDGHGTIESVSSAASTPVVNVNDVPTGSVAITGLGTQGQTLTATNTLADIDGLGSITYQWKADGTALATGSTLVLGEAQVGKAITLVASYTDGHGTAEAVTSAGTAAVVNVNDLPTGSVTISGVPTQGQTLTAANTLADLDGLGVIDYQWQVAGINISGAIGGTFVLTEAQVGKAITVVASYIDGHGTAEAVISATTAAVVNVNDPPIGVVTITGVATQGQTLTATDTLADIDGLGAITYQWKADGTNIATGSTLVLAEAQVGKVVTVVASYTDGHGTVESVGSAATTPVANVNDPGSVFINGTMAAGQTLTAVAADADGLGPVSYQWFADSVVIGGATTGDFLVSAAQVGHTITVTAKYTDLHGTAELVSGGLGKAVDLLAYSWKAHTLLDAVDVSAAGHAASTTAGGAASLTAGAGAILDMTAARGVPSAEAAATSQAVNLQDAIAILKMIVGLDVNGAGKALSPYQAYAADFDGNGKVELSDAIAVLKHVVGLTSPDPQWLFFNEVDTTVPGKANLSPGTVPALSADMSSAGAVHVGLVGVLRGDVDGSYGGGGAQSLDTNQAGYFTALVAAHTDLSASQFGVYP